MGLWILDPVTLMRPLLIEPTLWEKEGDGMVGKYHISDSITCFRRTELEEHWT